MVEAFARAKSLADGGSARLEQDALAEFLASGAFERHVRRSRARNRERRAALLGELTASFGNDVQIAGANAGLHVVAWFRRWRPGVPGSVRHGRLTTMPRYATVVRLSSKGQLVIPAFLRRKLGLKTGQALAVRPGAHREIVLSPAAEDSQSLETMLRHARAWSAARKRDLVEELHDRRRRERAREAGKR